MYSHSCRTGEWEKSKHIPLYYPPSPSTVCSHSLHLFNTLDEDDFPHPVTATVTFSNGVSLPSTQSVDIAITEDSMLEGDHEFTLTITETSADPTEIVTITAPSTQTVMIDDDESKSNFISIEIYMHI